MHSSSFSSSSHSFCCCCCCIIFIYSLGYTFLFCFLAEPKLLKCTSAACTNIFFMLFVYHSAHRAPRSTTFPRSLAAHFYFVLFVCVLCFVPAIHFHSVINISIYNNYNKLLKHNLLCNMFCLVVYKYVCECMK